MGAGGSVSSSTADERVARARQVYALLDRDGAGVVPVEALKGAMHGVGGDDDAAVMQHIFSGLDGDGDGTLSLAEFEAAAVALGGGGADATQVSYVASPRSAGGAPAGGGGRRGASVEDAALRATFALLDRDASGAVSAEELFDVLHALSAGGGAAELDAADISALIHDFDTSGDGEIQRDARRGCVSRRVQRILPRSVGEVDDVPNPCLKTTHLSQLSSSKRWQRSSC